MRQIVETDGDVDERDYFRREAMGAFAHEIRTPLTAMRMVIELARRESPEGGLVLDRELAAMLQHSIDDLQELADDLQEQSRLARGKDVAAPGECDLRAALETAADLVRPGVALTGEPAESVIGPWDQARLGRALAGFAESANRIGDGGGTVCLRSSVQPSSVLIEFASGEPGGGARDLGADAGFAFFRSREYIVATGGSVQFTRSERFASFTITIPR